MLIGRDAAEFGSTFNFWLPVTVGEIWSWEFMFRNIRASEMSIFGNVDRDLHFRVYLLQALDDLTDAVRTFRWKPDENWLNGVGDIQRFFVFSRWHTFHPDMENKLCSSIRSRRTFFIELEYNWSKLTNNSRIGWTVFEKTDYTTYIPLHQEIMKKETKRVRVKDKLVFPPLPTGIVDCR